MLLWTAPTLPVCTEQAGRRVSGHNPGMSLQRVSWAVTVALFLGGALAGLLSGYQGYAAVALAVALAAAINLV